MIKWFAYIGLLLLFAPCLLAAQINNAHLSSYNDALGPATPMKTIISDTTKNKKQEPDDKKKIKEVAKAKKQPKPEKIDLIDNSEVSKSKLKSKRQRRPQGLERPPEIPRRNGG